MSKAERLNTFYNYLLSQGAVKKKQDFADRLNSSRTNFSSALNGDPKCLTDRFLKRVDMEFSDILTPDWILTGEGNMLKEQNAAYNQELIRLQREADMWKTKYLLIKDLYDELLMSKTKSTSQGKNLYEKAVDDLLAEEDFKKHVS